MNLIKKSLILLFFASPLFNPFSQQADPGTYIEFKDTSQKDEYVRLTIRNAPPLTIQFSFDYNFGVFELSANDNGDLHSQEFITGQNFGVRHGFGATMTVKYPLHKEGHLRLNASIMYNRFSSKFNKIFADNSEPDFVKYDVYSASAGLENNFTPSYRFKTYVGIALVGSIISGDARVTFQHAPASEYSIKPAFRLGLSFFSGLEYLLRNDVGLNFGLKFTHANLWLKQSRVSDNPAEIYLNDQKVANRELFSGFRQFAWGTFSCGVNYYFGVKEKHYYYRKHY
jgi:hypothetical protein